MKTANLAAGIVIFFGALFGILGLIMAFLPLRLMAVIPAGIAVIFGLGLVFLTRGKKSLRRWSSAILILGALGIISSMVMKAVVKNTVAQDLKFENKLKHSAQDQAGDLDQALKDIDSKEIKKSP